MTGRKRLLLAGIGVPLVYAAGAVQIEPEYRLTEFQFSKPAPPSELTLVAQQRPIRPVLPPAPFDAQKREVTIEVAVLEPQGRYVSGLNQSNFRVFEDEVEQTVTGFSNAFTPVSLGVVVNLHGGAGISSDQTQAEVSRQIAPLDEFFFSYVNGPGVRLFDAIYDAVSRLGRSRDRRKILCVLTDQADSDSQHTSSQILEGLEANDIQFFEAASAGQPDEPALREIAEAMGGRRLVTDWSDSGVGAVVGGFLAARLGSYALTYAPSNQARDGSFRHIRVDVAGTVGLPPLTARTRVGYFAPPKVAVAFSPDGRYLAKAEEGLDGSLHIIVMRVTP